MPTIAKGFNIVKIDAVEPGGGLRDGMPGVQRNVRMIHCQNCERRLASVQNFVGQGLANVQIECICGVETSLVLVATLRQDRGPSPS